MVQKTACVGRFRNWSVRLARSPMSQPLGRKAKMRFGQIAVYTLTLRYIAAPASKPAPLLKILRFPGLKKNSNRLL